MRGYLMAEPTEISNSPPKTTSGQRKAGTQISTAAIESIRYVVDLLKPFELSPEQRLRTYQSMLLDDAVKSGVEIRTTLIESAQSNGYFKYDKNNETSKEVADYLSYCMANMDMQTPRSVGRDASDFIYKGFAPFEFVGKRGGDEYSDKWVIKKLAYVDSLSLDQSRPIEVAKDGNSILNLRQQLSSFRGTYGNLITTNIRQGVSRIPWKKVVYSSYSSTTSQPLGISALDACYTAWREKILLQDYTLIGVTKDFAGTPVLYVPSELTENAAANPNSDSAKVLEQLKSGMANMHTGDQNYIILPSDTQAETGTGSKKYEIKFLGVEGGGKGFDTEALVEQRKKAIFTALGASNLISGESGGGSYNLLEGQSDIQAHYVKRDTSVVDEMWNKQVFPMLMDLNGWVVRPKDMPVWVSGAVQPLSTKEFTSGIQKLGAAGVLPVRNADFVNEVLEKSGLLFKVDPTNPDWMDDMSTVTSRSGDGMKEGLNNGVGTSTSSGGDRSVSNNDND